MMNRCVNQLPPSPEWQLNSFTYRQSRITLGPFESFPFVLVVIQLFLDCKHMHVSVCYVVKSIDIKFEMKLSAINLRHIPCGPSMVDHRETSWNWPRWFPAGFLTFFINKKNFEKKIVLIKKSKNLSETAVAGFRRFPDNPSLTDHMILCYFFDPLRYSKLQKKRSANLIYILHFVPPTRLIGYYITVHKKPYTFGPKES